jgi:hypothetical protein
MPASTTRVRSVALQRRTGPASDETQLWKATAKLRHMEADQALMVEAFGNELAKRKKYKSLHGLDAVHFWLVERYRWTPSVVRAMNFEELHFLLVEEMHDWRMPPEVIDGMNNWRGEKNNAI